MLIIKNNKFVLVVGVIVVFILTFFLLCATILCFFHLVLVFKGLTTKEKLKKNKEGELNAGRF